MKSLAPYSGRWTHQKLKTLLDRTMFGYSVSQWKSWKSRSKSEVVSGLMEKVNIGDPPVNTSFATDPFVAIGDTWVESPYSRGDKDALKFRRQSLVSWVVSECLTNRNTLYPKMILFWHNHFPIDQMGDMRYNYQYYHLLHRHALGNFKQLTLEMTIEPAMLRYLNGNRNTKASPNENFARELLELFTIGKGEQVSDEDYTNYTEQDVRAIARALTGWRDFGYFSESKSQIGVVFRHSQHDSSTKTLSHRFDQVRIPDLGDEEYKKVIDIIFEKKEVARFMSRKLFRYFVGSEIDSMVEQHVIEPLADILYDHDYEIQPALEALLTSEVFYDDYYSGAIIKSPLEFLLPMYYHIAFHLDDHSDRYYRSYQSVFVFSAQLGQTIFRIPQVAGWTAYYQAPGWSKNWISTNTLTARHEIVSGLLRIPTRYTQDGWGSNLLELIAHLDHPEDPVELIREWTLYMLPKPLTEAQISHLKEYFIPGLPDYEWTVEYHQFLANPQDRRLTRSLNDKLKTLVYYIISLPDYQVI